MILRKIRENILLRRMEKLAYMRELSNLDYTTEVNMNELVSDLRFLKESRWERIKIRLSERFRGLTFCWIHVIGPDNNDFIRRFPMPMPYTVDINGKLYLFSPKSFRYVNGIAWLRFWDNNPFAVLYDEINRVATVDSVAFTAVLKSKHVIDATTPVQDDNTNVMVIIAVVLSGLACILSGACVYMISRIPIPK